MGLHVSFFFVPRRLDKIITFLQAIIWVLERENDENVFMYSWKELLDKAWDFSGRRWADFETVTDRLHAPRRIDYYGKKRLNTPWMSTNRGMPGMCSSRIAVPAWKLRCFH